MNKKIVNTHPAFGLVSFSRVTGKQNFVGSTLEQMNYIELEINHAEEVDSDYGKKYHQTGNVVRARLTSNQFAELITAMNIGEGVPCTISRLNGKQVEPLPQQTEIKSEIRDGFARRMEGFAKKLKERNDKAKILIAKPKLSKKDKEELNWLLDSITQETSENIPFYSELAHEEVEKVVVEAKIEIDAAIHSKIVSAGMESLGISSKRIEI